MSWEMGSNPNARCFFSTHLQGEACLYLVVKEQGSEDHKLEKVDSWTRRGKRAMLYMVQTTIPQRECM
jgi:hypothetical protein